MALGIHHPGLFMATVLLLNVTPGVDMLLTTRNTLRHGWAGGAATALGINAGCVVHTLAAAFGLAALLSASAEAFTVLKWAGAAWLAWIAVGLLRGAGRGSAAPVADAAAPVGSVPLGALFRQGLLTNVLNPKVAIFFLALLPQFIDPRAASKTVAFVALGAVLIAQGLAFMLLLVTLVSRLKRLGPRPAFRRGAEGASGLLMLGLAARLALTESP